MDSDCKDPKPGEKSETVSRLRDDVAGLAAKIIASVTISNESFAEMAAMADIYEKEASQIVLRRSDSEDIIKFAQQMIEDHSRTAEGLKSVLGSLNTPIMPPIKLNALFQVLIDDLKGSSDEDFDKRYIAQQKNVHNTAITLVKSYRARGENSALRELCKSILPVYEHHMEMVQQIADEN